MGLETFDVAAPIQRRQRARVRLGGRVQRQSEERRGINSKEDEDEDEDEDDSGDDEDERMGAGDPVGLDENDEFILSKDVWETIGQEMHDGRTTIPAVYGRPPRNIFKYHNSFKAAEYSNWILLHSVLLLCGRLPERYLEHRKIYVRIWSYVCAREITKEEINDLEKLCKEYIIGYEQLYCRGRNSRLR